MGVYDALPIVRSRCGSLDLKQLNKRARKALANAPGLTAPWTVWRTPRRLTWVGTLRVSAPAVIILLSPAAATATPTATPPAQAGSSTDNLAVGAGLALTGGLAGSLATIAGDVLVSRRRERQRVVALLRAVAGEIAAIYELCDAVSRNRDGFMFPPHLPTRAWEMLQTSAIGPPREWELLVSQLRETYTAVDAANQAAAQAAVALAIAQLHPQYASREGFQQQADRLSREPFLLILETPRTMLVNQIQRFTK